MSLQVHMLLQHKRAEFLFQLLQDLPTSYLVQGMDKFVFVEYDPTRSGRRNAKRGTIRAQAARVSSDARLDTLRKRVVERTGLPAADSITVFKSSRPPSRADRAPPSEQQEEEQSALYDCIKDRDLSTTVHAHKILGGSIPIAQADIATLSNFLQRFNTGAKAERPWISLVMGEAESRAKPTLTSLALQANATALFANDLKKPEIRMHATELYLSAITKLQSLLNSPRWRDSETMYTCMILSFHEVIQGSDPNATQVHVRGVAHLIHQRGPETFSTGLEHKTFRFYRVNLLMMSLVLRQPSFLAEADWKTIPFAGDVPPKTILDALIDVLLDVPGVLAALETLRGGGLHWMTLAQKAFELAYMVRCSIYDLERWKENYIWTYPTICTTPDLKRLDLMGLCQVAIGIIPYDSRLAEALNCYSAAHLLLARVVHGLAERSFIMQTALRPPHTIPDLVRAIVLISKKHLDGDNADLISSITTSFPLKVARGTTELNDPPLVEDLNGLLSRIDDNFRRKYNINHSVSS